MNTHSVLLIKLVLILSGLLTHVRGLVNAANLQCNSASKLKQTTIKNPAKLMAATCSYSIKPYSSKVCQLLVEFHTFELQSPSWDSNTNTLECGDNLQIGDFILCGSNSGQHLYMPFNVAGGLNEIALAFHLPNRWSQSIWSITVTQLECPGPQKRSSSSIILPFLDNNNLGYWRTIFPMPAPSYSDWDLLAPPGCNQYYTKSTGNIKSFNYKDDGSTYYPPNMNYVICIKSTAAATMIEYHALKFSMSTAVPSGSGFDEDCRSAVQTTGRREDYLMIPQSNVASSLNIQPTYYCGTSLQTQSTLLASAPFIMYFSSDGTTDNTETGFNINYNIRTLF